MSHKPILDPNRSYTFSNYFDLNVDAFDLVTEFGYNLVRTQLRLPQFSGQLKQVDALKEQIEAILPYVDLVNETARREIFIAPIVLELVRLTHARLSIEYPLQVNWYDELAAWRSWRTWQESVDKIEARTKLNLLSNVPNLIQDDLERRDDILGISAPILANMTEIDSELLITRRWPFDQLSIGQSSLVEKATVIRSTEIDRPSKTSTNQSSFQHPNTKEVSFLKNNGSQNSFIEVGMTKVSANTLTSTQFGST